MIYVFDLDGTLIDSSERHFLLMCDVLKHYNFSVPSKFETDFIEYKANGNSGFDYLSKVLQIDLPIARKIISDWIAEIEDEKWLRFDRLYEDTIKTCEQCIKNGQSLYYLTSRKNREGLHNELQRLKIDQYPIKVIIVDPVYAKKEKAEALRLIVKEYSQCIMVGDSEIDYYAACQTNSSYYILNRGFRSELYWDQRGIISYPSLDCLFLQE